MGTSSMNATYNVAKSIVSKIRGKRYGYGRKLNSTNRLTVIGAQRLFVLTLCSFRATDGYPLKTSLLSELVTSLNKTDVIHVLTALGELDSTLLANQPINQDRLTLQESRGFVDLLLQLIKPFVHRWYHCNDIIAFAKLHQLFSFQSRLSLELPELRQTAYDAWLSTELKCFPEPQGMQERDIISGWFPPLRKDDFFSNFIPIHGTGAVSEKIDYPAKKWGLLSLTANNRLFLKQIGIQTDEFSLIRAVNEFEVPLASSKICRVTFVNKTWKTYRTISCEDATNMFIQQGIGHCMDLWLKKHETPFSRYYAISTEERNRRLAFIGSIHGCYDTIDLSAASDSVMWKLVKSWFSKSFLKYALWCTRTKYVSVKDPVMRSTSVYEQQKFAPMGSRMCFPVETIVFGAIAKASCVQARLTNETDEYPDFVVYGDDIVIRHEATPYLLRRLDELGFVVNESKSFTEFEEKFCFRESCGGEYLNGYNVTPIRLSRNGFKGLLPPCPHSDWHESYLRQVAGLIQLANRTRNRLPFVHKYLVENILEQDLPLQWSADGTQGLQSLHPSYRGLKQYRHRWNSDYQRYEVQVLQLAIIEPENPGPDTFAYRSRRNEYDSQEEYDRACAEWDHHYELWWSYRLRELDNEYLEREFNTELLYSRLAALEKRADHWIPEGGISPSLTTRPEDLTLKEAWVEEEHALLMLRA